MPVEKLGEVLAILGMVVLVLTSFGRRRGSKGSEAPASAQRLKWGDYAAFGLILVGLLLIWAGK